MSKRRLLIAEERERRSRKRFTRRSSFVYLPVLMTIIAALDYPTGFIHDNKAFYNNALLPMLVGMSAGLIAYIALRRSGPATQGMAGSMMILLVWIGVDVTILFFIGYWSALAFPIFILLGLILFRRR